MNSRTTYVWGSVADPAGIIHHSRVEGEKLPGGGLRVRQHHEYAHEPASAYATSHPSPMEMRWQHQETIGRVVALRRAHCQLFAVAECELEPDDLALLTEKYGDLRWSTSTENRRRDPLRITEVSLTPGPATVGLPGRAMVEARCRQGQSAVLGLGSSRTGSQDRASVPRGAARPRCRAGHA